MPTDRERDEIACAMRATEDVEGHVYREVERHEDGCAVSVLKCERCGKISVGWWKADNPPPKIGPGDSLPEVPDARY